VIRLTDDQWWTVIGSALGVGLLIAATTALEVMLRLSWA
jgi:hypothetical protein